MKDIIKIGSTEINFDTESPFEIQITASTMHGRATFSNFWLLFIHCCLSTKETAELKRLSDQHLKFLKRLERNK